MSENSARPPSQAGAFYTADPEELRSEVEAYIAAAPLREMPRPALGFIAPHAGFRFSGPTAGYVYSQLRALAPEVVFILAASHRAHFPYPSIWDGEGYRTPLGVCPTDVALADRLREAMPGIECQQHADTAEHSLEVQVPFLQVACPEGRIVPILMGATDRSDVAALAGAILQAIDGTQPGRIAFLASSDGYHGYRLAECKTSDARLAEALEAMDTDGVYGLTPTGDPMACGRGPIAAVIDVCRALGATQGAILNQSTSADTIAHTDGQWVVGYTAAEFR
jgi:MEMO1 family protein